MYLKDKYLSIGKNGNIKKTVFINLLNIFI
jgi:hypothetical protein